MPRSTKGSGESASSSRSDPRRIVVVGPCASGKTTLVAALRKLGFDARASGQEHSEIASLWSRTAPDVLIALEVDISAVRARRRDDWPEWLHNIQARRLASAHDAADFTIDTSLLDEATTVTHIVAFLASGRQSRR